MFFSSAFKRFSRRQFSNNVHFFSRRQASYYYFDKPRSTTQGLFLTPQHKKFLTYAGIILGVIVVSHIEEAPVTHRKRLMLCPQWLEDDLGKISYRSIMAQYGRYVLPDNNSTAIRVRKVMSRLIHAAENYRDPETGQPQNLFTSMGGKSIPFNEWKIHVIDDVAMRQETPNAFVIGDGKVFVFRSILPLCRDDDGLATVLAHELGHQLAHHIGEKLTKSPLYVSLVILSYALIGSNNIGNLAVSLGLEKPASRNMETEADYIGLMLMSTACFNPHEAPDFWARMISFESKMGGSIPELISTHPSSQRRNVNLKEWMPRAKRQYELAGCGNFAQRFKSFSLF
ncbi:hypothetical protein FOA43_003968 [Brettanomyces nanus]|uniref:Peptidase M48 domain-containing protein n=1 Tax=Eeniella nana TaxID=13502 RepID=A0A875RWY0_EENNA|nr:uncharacterized protein FOA43_003968 [Brettanomyces nanus]QPG76577.1 hypothetical protein FOA43_003968 [Brettanomyces nanus]